MNSVAEAINTLISAVNVAHGKSAYSLEESHYIYLAINYLNKLSQEGAAEQAGETQKPQAPSNSQEIIEDHEPQPGDQPSSY